MNLFITRGYADKRVSHTDFLPAVQHRGGASKRAVPTAARLLGRNKEFIQETIIGGKSDTSYKTHRVDVDLSKIHFDATVRKVDGDYFLVIKPTMPGRDNLIPLYFKLDPVDFNKDLIRYGFGSGGREQENKLLKAQEFSRASFEYDENKGIVRIKILSIPKQ